MPNYGSMASVFNWRTARFDVYELANPPLLMSDAPACAPSVRPTAIGVEVGAALCPLPAGAKFIGTSPVPVGSLVRVGAGIAGGGPAGLPPQYGPALGLGGLDGLGGGGLGALGEVLAVSVAAQILTPLVVRVLRGR